MDAKELFEEFLTYCKDYESDINGIVIKNEENIFKLFEPTKKSYLVFEATIGKAREQGSVDDIDELLEVATSTVGEEKIKVKQRNPYML